MTIPVSKTIRRRVFEIMEIQAFDDRKGLVFDHFMVWLILANVVAVSLETIDPIYDRYFNWFLAFEIISVGIFTVEYVLRVWISVEHLHYPRDKPVRARLRYLCSPYALIDLLAILPFYLSLVWDLRILRVFRLLRLLKLARYSPALNTLARALYAERRALMATGVIMLGLIVLSATIIYYLERQGQPEAFGSIPEAMWWSIATLTTVGYGDIVPMTPAGRAFGGVVMVFGLGMYALPLGIIASAFISEIRHRDFVVNPDILSRVPVFKDLDLQTVTRITELLRARIFNPGDVITRRGDYADSMYFVISGEVELTMADYRHRLGPGDFFGEIALLANSLHYLKATAGSRCQLMVLEKTDFLHLIRENPAINTAILTGASERLEIGIAELGVLSEKEIDEARAAIRMAIAPPV